MGGRGKKKEEFANRRRKIYRDEGLTWHVHVYVGVCMCVCVCIDL